VPTRCRPTEDARSGVYREMCLSSWSRWHWRIGRRRRVCSRAAADTDVAFVYPSATTVRRKATHPLSVAGSMATPVPNSVPNATTVTPVSCVSVCFPDLVAGGEDSVPYGAGLLACPIVSAPGARSCCRYPLREFTRSERTFPLAPHRRSTSTSIIFCTNP